MMIKPVATIDNRLINFNSEGRNWKYRMPFTSPVLKVLAKSMKRKVMRIRKTNDTTTLALLSHRYFFIQKGLGDWSWGKAVLVVGIGSGFLRKVVQRRTKFRKESALRSFAFHSVALRYLSLFYYSKRRKLVS
jgi:hypothetical protein